MDFSPSKFAILKKLFAKHASCEIEARFGKFGKDSFVPILSAEQFDRIFNYFERMPKHFKYSMRKQTITVFEDGVKSIQENDGEQLMRKVKEATFDVRDYSARFCFSSEKEAELGSNVVAHSFSRTRHSFVGEKVVIDLDIFADGNLTGELELVNGGTIDIFVKHVALMLNIIQDSDTIIKNSEVRTVINKMSKKFIGVQPVPVSHKKISREPYSLTKKLDGQRGLLLSIGKDVYVLHSNMKVRKTSFINNGEDFVMDGEYLKGDFHVFDMIVPSIFLPERLELARKHVGKLDCPKSKIYVKNFVHSTDLPTDFNQMADSIAGKDVYDGLIMVRTEADYENSRPLKWKPVITIDFQIKKKPENIFQFYCYDKNLLVLFQENEVHPDAYSSFTENDIVECSLDDHERFIPLKVRYDKNRPNWLNVAKDNLEMIKSPFFFERSNEKTNSKRFMHFCKRYVLDILINRCKVKSIVHLSAGPGNDTTKFIDAGFRYIELVDGNEEAHKKKQFYSEKPETKNIVINVNVSDSLPIKVVVYENKDDMRNVKGMVNNGTTAVSFGVSDFKELEDFAVEEIKIEDLYIKWKSYHSKNLLDTMPWKSVLIFTKK